MDLFEDTDVTASIYLTSEDALGSLGMTRGPFVYLFRNSDISSFSCGRDIFENAPCVETDLFQKRCVLKRSGYM